MKQTITDFEFYGDEAQVAQQRRYYRLWRFLQANPRLSFVGRAIGLDEPVLEDIPALAGLAKELGFLPLAFTSQEVVDALEVAPEAEGLQVGLWQHLISGDGYEEQCRAVMATRQLPAGYRFERITRATPPRVVREFQDLMQKCGVAPLPGYILRDLDVPTIAEMVLTAQGRIAAVGAGIFRHSAAGPNGKAAHVGFLGTDPGERGQGLARLLLARIILACSQEYGADKVHTGVRAENVASQHVCRDCGLEDSGTFFTAVFYPPVLRREHLTS
jgi:GNAT superfamily N-acetyltransferase